MMLVERDGDLETLDGCLRSSRGGSGRLVIIDGEAGAGKTALVQEFCSSVRDVKLLMGACDPLTTPRPLGPIMDMAGELAVIGGAPIAPEASRTLLAERFTAELTSGSRTSLVVIEDVHWADEATLALLQSVARRLDQARGLVVVTARGSDLPADDPARIAIDRLAASDGAERVRLAPLTRDGIARLAQELHVEAADLDAVYAVTRGNPFLVVEALSTGGERVPMSVRDSVLARLARLDTSARVVVEAAAVIPTRVPRRMLAALSGVRADRIDVEATAGLLREDVTDTVAFRHELARLAVEAELLPARRSALHAHVLALLVDEGGEPIEAARAAYHAELAGDAAATRTYAVMAAEQAVDARARREAADQYARALRHVEGISLEELFELWNGYARTAGRADRPQEMVKATEMAVKLQRQIGDPHKLGHVLWGHAIGLHHAGHQAAALEAAYESVAVLEALEPGPLLADALGQVAAILMQLRRLDESEPWARRSIELADRIDAKQALMRGLNTMGSALLLRGDPGGVELLDRSVREAEAVGNDDFIVLGWVNLGQAAAEARMYAIADPALTRTVELAREYDFDGWYNDSVAWLARTSFEQGDWEAAERYLGKVALDRVDGDAQWRTVALTVAGRLRARRGQGDPWPYLDESWAVALASKDPSWQWPIAAARAEAVLLEGAPERVAELAGDTYAVACDRQMEWAIGELGALLVRSGALERVPDTAAEPYRAHGEGQFRRAAAAWREVGCPYEAAESLADSPDAADLRAALDTFHDLGALPMADRTRRRLRQLGVLDVPKAPQRAPSAGLAGLTSRQQQVLFELAEGRTNEQIAHRLHIAPKTVGNHVSAILRSLQVASRAEAVHLARRHGLLDA